MAVLCGSHSPNCRVFGAHQRPSGGDFPHVEIALFTLTGNGSLLILKIQLQTNWKLKQRAITVAFRFQKTVVQVPGCCIFLGESSGLEHHAMKDVMSLVSATAQDLFSPPKIHVSCYVETENWNEEDEHRRNSEFEKPQWSPKWTELIGALRCSFFQNSFHQEALKNQIQFIDGWVCCI